jgi:hypothetical protein
MDDERRTRANLTNKMLCNCPICQQKIYGGMLGLNELDIKQIQSFPFGYTYVHKHQKEDKPHAITIFFDADLKVRGVDASLMCKMEL